MSGLEEIIRGHQIFSSLLNRGGQEPMMQEGQLLEQLSTATESPEVERLYKKDVAGFFGKTLNKILDWKGYGKNMPDHYAYLDLPEKVMAATIRLDNGVVILAYNQKYREILLNDPLTRQYVNFHEHAHVRGELSEYTTDALVLQAARNVRKNLEGAYNKFIGWGKKAYNGINGILNDAYQIERHAAQRLNTQ